jgi:hypothetical protein
MPKHTKKMKSLLSNLQKANEARHSKASKLDLSLQEEILANTDLPLSPQKNYSIVDLPLSSSESSDDDEIIDLEAPEYDNKDNNIGETSKKKNHRVYYTGLAPRTIRYKKQKLREAAVGTANIMDFFKLVSKEEEEEEEEEEVEEEDDDEVEVDEDEDNTKITNAINFIERIINNNNNSLSKNLMGKYSWVQLYLRHLLLGKKMMEASNTVAELHGKGVYYARCIRRWAKICLEGVFLFVHCTK